MEQYTEQPDLNLLKNAVCLEGVKLDRQRLQRHMIYLQNMLSILSDLSGRAEEMMRNCFFLTVI